MAGQQEQEKTEEATQQRREDFRKRGQVAQTRELASVFVLVGSAGIFWLLSQFFLKQIFEIMSTPFTHFIISASRGDDIFNAVSYVAIRGAAIVFPICGMLMVLGVAATVLQVGILNNEEAFDLNLDRINPINGLKRLFSMRSVAEGIKSILKILIISLVAYLLIESHLSQLPQLISLSLQQLIYFTGSMTLKLVGGLGLFMGLIAAADYFYQRWELEKEMRMTKQELKEEHKNREGDPLIKARVRRIQREMANKRMMASVAKAEVIVTNPTHIACALSYDPEKMAAPQLVAKGSGVIAERIKEIAREHNIPIVENKPLARAMFKTMKLGQTIPRELFSAVAQVLSYIYKLKRKAVQ